MTTKAYQSKLAELEVEITKLRAKRPPVPYRQIASELHERFGIKVDPATVFRFVKVRSKGRRVFAMPPLRSRQNRSDRRMQDAEGTTVHSLISPSTETAARPSRVAAQSVPATKKEPFLKTFVPGNEYNLTRLSPEDMEAFERELDRQIELERHQRESQKGE
jgi:hypothetical protein